MTDLYAFRANRSPRRVEPDDDVLTIVYEETLPGPLTHVAPPIVVRWGGGALLALLESLSANADLSPQQRAAQAQQAAGARLDEADAVDEEMLAGDADPLLGENGSPSPQPFPGQRALHLLVELDHWLVSAENRPAGGDLDARLAWLVRRAFDEETSDDAELLAQTIERRPWFYEAFSAARARVVDCLAAALLLSERGALAQRLTRLLLVAGVMDSRSHAREQLEADGVHRLLSTRTPLLPAPPFPDVLPQPRIRLVRQVSVSDLFVVRREWRCYAAGEIADIRNVLVGEHQEQKTTRIDEREVIEISASETEAATETSIESSGESSFSEETRREMQLDLESEGQVDVSGQYGPTRVDVSAGFEADFTLEDSTKRAVTIAQRATSKAASRVANRTRTERTERLLTRFEDFRHHDIDNGHDGHVRGIYRWVNRIDRLQVWRYPDRMQLEFELPEPGRFLLEQLSEQPYDPAALPKPPDFDVARDDITPDNYLELAAKYGATGLPEPPEPRLGVSDTIALNSTDPLPNSGSEYWNAESMSGRVEIAIPPGYVATAGKARVAASPIHAVWRREFEQRLVGWEALERYHTITAFVAVGDNLVYEKQVGPDETKVNTIQLTGTADSQPEYLEAVMDGEDAATLAFDPGLVAKAPVSLTVTGAASANLAIELDCELTAQAKAQWVQDVFDALHSAYDTQIREWRAEQTRTGLRGSASVFERSPVRQQELIREELRRHVISWLLDESPFLGRPAVAPDAPGGPGAATDVTPDIDVQKALAAAPDIRFLEQCLEWTNMTYVTYPYYWADRARWSRLIDLDTVDPELGRFLRAGSVRVVVPARPGFASAVQHWLLFRQPWLGGPAPTPGNPLYVSVAKEIRDQTEPPVDGQPAESWEIMLPTTLLWLDESAGLPRNELARLGQAPHEPEYPLCPYGSQNPE